MSARRRRSLFVLALLLLALAAAGLRLETVGQRMIWFDETYTDTVARQDSVSAVVERSKRDFAGNMPPLHYLLCFAHYHVSDSLASLRMTSVESGVLSVLALVALGSLVFGRAVGLVAGALMTFSIYHINYSQDARPYALLLLLVILAYLCMFAFLAAGRWRWLPLFVASATASVYTHHFAWIFQACIASALACAIAARYRRRAVQSSGARWQAVLGFSLLGYASLALLYLPLAADLMEFFARSGAAETHTLSLSLPFFWELFGRWGNGNAWAPLYAAAFVAGVLAIASRRDASLALILWFAVPFLVFALLPSRSRLFDIRYVMGALPAFLLIVALGIVCLVSQGQQWLVDRWPKPWLRGARLRNLAVAGSTLLFVGLSLDAYRTFRQTRIRCSQFYGTQQILDRHDGFCRKYLILNSLYPPHSYIWKKRPVERGPGVGG